jgi:hypothetical protein
LDLFLPNNGKRIVVPGLAKLGAASIASQPLLLPSALVFVKCYLPHARLDGCSSSAVVTVQP